MLIAVCFGAAPCRAATSWVGLRQAMLIWMLSSDADGVSDVTCALFFDVQPLCGFGVAAMHGLYGCRGCMLMGSISATRPAPERGRRAGRPLGGRSVWSSLNSYSCDVSGLDPRHSQSCPDYWVLASF